MSQTLGDGSRHVDPAAVHPVDLTRNDTVTANAQPHPVVPQTLPSAGRDGRRFHKGMAPLLRAEGVGHDQPTCVRTKVLEQQVGHGFDVHFLVLQGPPLVGFDEPALGSEGRAPSGCCSAPHSAQRSVLTTRARAALPVAPVWRAPRRQSPLRSRPRRCSRPIGSLCAGLARCGRSSEPAMAAQGHRPGPPSTARRLRPSASACAGHPLRLRSHSRLCCFAPLQRAWPQRSRGAARPARPALARQERPGGWPR